MSSSDAARNGRRFVASFAVSLALAAAAMLLVIWLVDPTGLLRGAGLSPDICASGFVSSDDRYVKPIVAASHHAPEVLVGSSRVAYAFAPGHFGGREVANLGFAGANLEGIDAMVRHAAERRMVRRIWIGVDFGTFLIPESWQQSPRPPRSPRGAETFALRHGLLSRRAAADALRSIIRPALCRSERPLTANGFRSRHFALFTPAAVTPEMRDYLADQWSLSRPLQAQLLAYNLIRFERLLAELRVRRIEPVLFLSPTSPVFRELVAEAGLDPLYAHWRGSLRAAARRQGARLIESDTREFLLAIETPPCPAPSREACMFEDITHYRSFVAEAIVRAGDRGG